MNKTVAQFLLGLFLCPFGDNIVDARFNSNINRFFNNIPLNESIVVKIFAVTEYYKMPRLHLMDDFDLCMDQPHNLTVYCIATVILKPNTSLPLWEYIDEFSRNRKKHFRHDRLQRGVCVNRCSDLLSELDEYTLSDLSQEEFEYENEVSRFFFKGAQNQNNDLKIDFFPINI